MSLLPRSTAAVFSFFVDITVNKSTIYFKYMVLIFDLCIIKTIINLIDAKYLNLYNYLNN